MKLLAGLGNPGNKYDKTRHNIGFMVIDALADEKWQGNKNLQSSVAHRAHTVLIKPQTFMNKSGLAVSAAAHFYQVDLADLIVIHDDLDLPFGKLRIQKGGYSAGHKGIESITTTLGSQDFIRLRIGVGRPNENEEIEDFVLSPFSKEEFKKLSGVVALAVRAVNSILEDGLERAQSQFN